MDADDPRGRLSLPAIALIAGPLLLAIASAIDIENDDNKNVYLNAVAEHTSRHLAAGALFSLGALIFLVGTVHLYAAMRRSGRTLGAVASGLLSLGMVGFSAVLAFDGFDVAMATVDRPAGLTVANKIDHITALNVYWITIFFAGIVLGALLLVIALLRRRVVPIWSPILIVVSLLLSMVGSDALVSAAASVVLAIALVPVAMTLLSPDPIGTVEPRGVPGAPPSANPTAEPAAS